MRYGAIAIALWAGCGGDDATATDPCAAHAGTCITLTIEQGSSTSARIDALALDLLYGTTHATPTTTPTAPIDLPASVAVTFDLPMETSVGVVAAGRLANRVVGTGYGAVTIAPGAHVTLELALAPPAACPAQDFVCGGGAVVGAPDTLYRCDADGVPRARGGCTNGCTTLLGAPDQCAGSATCLVGGFYCGGDKVEGDPGTLYRCSPSSQPPTVQTACTNGCIVAPTGTDDHCR